MTLEQLALEVQQLRDLIRRHKHDNIETDKLPVSSLKPEGNDGQILTSNGIFLAPTYQNPPGISASASKSPSASASRSQSPSASLSPSASVSPSV